MKIGTNLRFGDDGLTAELVDTEGRGPSRQVRRALRRRGEKAIRSRCKQHAKEFHIQGGSAVINCERDLLQRLK